MHTRADAREQRTCRLEMHTIVVVSGVPVTVKEILKGAGLPTNSGTRRIAILSRWMMLPASYSRDEQCPDPDASLRLQSSSQSLIRSVGAGVRVGLREHGRALTSHDALVFRLLWGFQSPPGHVSPKIPAVVASQIVLGPMPMAGQNWVQLIIRRPSRNIRPESHRCGSL
jgi:hypothetical protein